MKNFIILLLTLVATASFGQVGIGTTTPSTKSMLEVSSTSDNGNTYKGFMPPRVPTTTARDLINPGLNDFGLLVFVQATGCLQIWTGNSWVDITCITVATPEIWLNEIHYDNAGTDTMEGFEIAGQAGVDLTDYEVYRYNGSNGQVTGAILGLTGVLADQSNGFGTMSTILPTNGLQNDNEALALVRISTGNVIQFLSYEGAFLAVDGPAAGTMSTDIGVSEPGTTPVGQSLQLIGTGNEFSEFTWSSPSTASMGNINTLQIIN